MDIANLGYIIAAYLVAAVVLAAMVGTILLDYRRLRRSLDRLFNERSKP